MNINEALQQLNEIAKEDDLYFQGAFWIKSESLNNIINGNFTLLIGSKILTDYYGDYAENVLYKKSELTHRNLWKKVSDNNDWDYYPRGRVAIDQGTAYIHINSKCSTDKIIDEIIKEYKIDKLRIVLDYNNEYQGEHYNFKLK